MLLTKGAVSCESILDPGTSKFVEVCRVWSVPLIECSLSLDEEAPASRHDGISPLPLAMLCTGDRSTWGEASDYVMICNDVICALYSKRRPRGR